ncbi:MAG: hypothetical protein EB045_03000 [Actinobacteria bacterium]|nr:hypothetical protein [Actinomycetota bacterium]
MAPCIHQFDHRNPANESCASSVKAIQEFLTYLIYSALWRIVRLLPERTAYKFFERIAERAYRKNGKRIARLRENYRQVLPLLENDELEALVRSGVSSAMRYWCDTFRISDWSQERVAATVTTENNELFLDSVKSGKGVIIALPHAGNWDHAGLYYCSQDLITAYVSFTEIGINIRFSGPFLVRRSQSESDEIQRLTQELANQFARDIKSDPSSWHMQQRIFVERVNK